MKKYESDTEQVIEIYKNFDEDSRLNRSQSARVEFLTSVRYIEKYLNNGDKILDVGAGAGEYSIYFADKGYDISALELSQDNINAFEKKILSSHNIDLVQGNAIDLSNYPDNQFDIVLVFGPLYHLRCKSDRAKCIREAKRVCKDNGYIFFAFISNDQVIANELSYNPDYFSTSGYDHKTFKLEDFPFVFFTFDKCLEMLENEEVNIVHRVAADGLSEMLADRIDKLNEYDYSQYLNYHFYCCEKPELVGRSNHYLFVGKK